jgi:hypothetical protein
MSQTIQTQMTSDDTKKEALDDVDVAEVNETSDTDAERSSINIKTGGLPIIARTWSIISVFLS